MPLLRIKTGLITIGFVVLASVAVAQVFNVRDYGAVADTNHCSTDAFNAAINACHKNGGGRVEVPPGNYRSGTIVLKDHTELFLEAGATIYASTDNRDFPEQRHAYRSQKDSGGWYALIYAQDAQDISIAGKGTINGRGRLQSPRIKVAGTPEDLNGRVRNILLVSCKQVLVEGITMVNSNIWNQHYLNCEDVLVNRVKVFNHGAANNDGIDIDGCRSFTLTNSLFDTDDDGICLKSTGPAACENVIINNCVVSSYCNAIKCGTESTGGFKNINISNCIIKPSASGLAPIARVETRMGITGVSLEIVDGGVMDGVVVNNMIIDGTQCPLYIRLGNRARSYSAGVPTPPVGEMRRIQISNINAYHCGNLSSSITGIPEANIEHITLSNITISNEGGLKPGSYLPNANAVPEDQKGYPQPTRWGNLPCYGLLIRHVNNISMDHISFTPVKDESRVPIIASGVQHLSIKSLGFTGHKLDILLENVSDHHIEKGITYKNTKH